MLETFCPGCGERISLRGLRAGDRIECHHCANLSLKVTADGGKLSLEEIPKATCPSCDRIIEVPAGLQSGDIIECCSEKYVLTYEFGAYALTKPK